MDGRANLLSTSELQEDLDRPVLHAPLPSSLLWGLDWSEKTSPTVSLVSDVVVKSVPWEDVYEYPLRAQPEVGEAIARDVRRQYFNKFYCDSFLFFRDGARVPEGCALLNVQDIETCYFRYIYLDPSLRRLSLFGHFSKWVCSVLKQHGVDRVEAHVSQADLEQVQRVQHMGYRICGERTSPRWGSLYVVEMKLNERGMIS